MKSDWPNWWQWELELTPQVERRVEDRDFTEVDLREMLEDARGYRQDVVEERWIIESRHRNRGWEVFVEPDADNKRLVIVTAYPVEVGK